LAQRKIVNITELTAKIRNFSEIGQPISLETEEDAKNVYKLLKSKKKRFKIRKNTIWRTI